MLSLSYDILAPFNVNPYIIDRQYAYNLTLAISIPFDFALPQKIRLPLGLGIALEYAAVSMHTALSNHCTNHFKGHVSGHFWAFLKASGFPDSASIVKAVVELFIDGSSRAVTMTHFAAACAKSRPACPEAQQRTIIAYVTEERAMLGLAVGESWNMPWGEANQELTIRFYAHVARVRTARLASTAATVTPAVGPRRSVRELQPQATSAAVAVQQAAAAMLPVGCPDARPLPAHAMRQASIVEPSGILVSASRFLHMSAVFSPLACAVAGVPHDALASIVDGVGASHLVGSDGLAYTPESVRAGIADLRALWQQHDPVYLAHLHAHLIAQAPGTPYADEATQERLLGLARHPTDADTAMFADAGPALRTFITMVLNFTLTAAPRHFNAQELQVALARSGIFAERADLDALCAAVTPGYTPHPTSMPTAARAAAAQQRLASLAHPVVDDAEDNAGTGIDEDDEDGDPAGGAAVQRSLAIVPLHGIKAHYMRIDFDLLKLAVQHAADDPECRLQAAGAPPAEQQRWQEVKRHAEALTQAKSRGINVLGHAECLCMLRSHFCGPCAAATTSSLAVRTPRTA